MVNEYDRIKTKDGPAVPGYTEEFGTRLKWIIDKIGTQKKAGDIAGVKPEMLGKYISGKAKPSVYVIALLCASAHESVDWLLNGDREPKNAPDGLSERNASSGPDSQGLKEKVVGDRLKRSRETVDAAVMAVDYDPPKGVWEAMRTIAFKYDVSIDDAAQLLDAIKHMGISDTKEPS